MLSRTFVLAMTVALLGGCGGGGTVQPPHSEPATQAVIETPAPAADDDDSGAGQAADDDDSAVTVADVTEAAEAAPAEEAAEVAEAAPAEDEAPPPPPDSDDPPYSLTASADRASETSATISVLLRASDEIADAVKWTVNAGPATVTGPKITKAEDDRTLVWNITGITGKAFAGSVVGVYEKHSIKSAFEIRPIDEAPPEE